MQLKKIITTLLTSIAVCFLCKGAFGDEQVRIFLDVDYNKNLIFNKYDIAIKMDGNRLSTVSQGERYTNLIPVSKGEHTLTFSKLGDDSVSDVWIVSVKEDATLACSVSAEKKEIEVSSRSNRAGLSDVFLVVPDLSYSMLTTAMKEMQEKGFINVQAKTRGGGSTISNNFGWIVMGQNPPGGVEVVKSDSIVLSCDDCNSFIARFAYNKNPQEAAEKIEEYGFTVSGCISSANGNTVTFQKNGIDKRNNSLWKVTKSDVKNDKSVVFTVTYQGESRMPNVIGLKLPAAINALKNAEFYDITHNESVWVANNWTVTGQNIQAGTNVKTSTKIVLTIEKK